MFSPYWTELTGDFGGPKICRLPAARSPRHHTNFPSPSLNRFLSTRGSMFIVTDTHRLSIPTPIRIPQLNVWSCAPWLSYCGAGLGTGVCPSMGLPMNASLRRLSPSWGPS